MPPSPPGLSRQEVVQIVNEVIDRLRNLPLGLGGLRRIGTTADSAAPGTLAANDFLVKTSSSTLSAERVVTNTSTVTWDWSMPGQAKASAVVSGLSVLTTKGDLWGYSTVNARVPVGTNGQVLTADSSEALGVKWATIASGGGDVVGPSSSVASEVALFDGNTGKLIKRAAITGIAKLASGVLSAATAGTDYYAPGSTDVAVADGGTGASTAAGARANLGGSQSRSALGFLELDPLGFSGFDSTLAGWRHSVAFANFSNGVTPPSYFGMAAPTMGGTSGSASNAGWTRHTGAANTNWQQQTRLIRRSWGFSVALSFKLPTAVTLRRLWVGVTSQNMTNSDTAPGHFVGVRYSTVAGDAGFVPVSRDGTTQTLGTAGGAPVADVPYLFVASGEPNGSSVRVVIYRLDTNAVILDSAISTTLPGSATAIDWTLYNYAQGATRATEIGQVVRLFGLT